MTSTPPSVLATQRTFARQTGAHVGTSETWEGSSTEERVTATVVRLDKAAGRLDSFSSSFFLCEVPDHLPNPRQSASQAAETDALCKAFGSVEFEKFGVLGQTADNFPS